jgi:mannose-6-phosphate isomerase-like protein (cupin superfamily)
MSKKNWMIATVLSLAPVVALAQLGQAAPGDGPLSKRIGRNDPSQFVTRTAIHDGAGSMQIRQLLSTEAVEPNLIFFHRGVIPPKAGIGQHFHNKCEEMFVILDGEAEFTIDGRTSLIKGPAGVPDRMGHSHSIYNPTDKPLQWLNINVGLNKVYDVFNLGDAHMNAPLDPIPQFISFHLDKTLLKPVDSMFGGKGTVQYRRALQPTVFSTTWSYIDHLVIPAGASVGPNVSQGLAEVYYVITGDGQVTAGSETAEFHSGDAIPIKLDVQKSFVNTGSGPLEFLIVGVAKDFATKDAMMAQAPKL